FKGWGTSAADAFPQVTIRIDGKDVKTFSVDTPQEKKDKPYYEVRGHYTAGGKKVAVAFTNGFEDKETKQTRKFGLEMMEIEGPINPVPKPDPDSVKLLLTSRPNPGTSATDAAQQVLANFARRAYRRPVKPDEVQRLM